MHAVLARYRVPRLVNWTGRPAARCTDLIPIDVTKLGRIADGGGHRTIARAAGGHPPATRVPDLAGQNT